MLLESISSPHINKNEAIPQLDVTCRIKVLTTPSITYCSNQSAPLNTGYSQKLYRTITILLDEDCTPKLLQVQPHTLHKKPKLQSIVRLPLRLHQNPTISKLGFRLNCRPRLQTQLDPFELPPPDANRASTEPREPTNRVSSRDDFLDLERLG